MKLKAADGSNGASLAQCAELKHSALMKHTKAVFSDTIPARPISPVLFYSQYDHPPSKSMFESVIPLYDNQRMVQSHKTI